MEIKELTNFIFKKEEVIAIENALLDAWIKASEEKHQKQNEYFEDATNAIKKIDFEVASDYSTRIYNILTSFQEQTKAIKEEHLNKLLEKEAE